MTNTHNELLGLAERVEGATGPDRELFLDVAKAVGQINEDAFPHSDGSFWWADGIAWGRIPDFFNSLDSAVTLKPEGWRVVGLREGLVPASHTRVTLQFWEQRREGKAATTPLAITAACLRAHASLREGDNR